MLGKEAVKFLQELAINNNREWFHAHKSEYEENLLNPAEIFSVEITRQLREISGYPLESKIFRINRDIRFSKDKTPYNTYLRIGFYYHKNPCSPGFYFSLEGTQIVYGTGLFQFDKEQLEKYQQAVINESSGQHLVSVLDTLQKKYELSYIERYKKIPCGLTEDFARSELLKNKGLALWYHDSDLSKTNWNELVTTTVEHYRRLLPLFNWLANIFAEKNQYGT